MGAHLLRIFHVLPTGDPDGVVFGLYIQISPVDPRQLDDRDEIVSALEDVDRGIGASAAGAVSKPITGKPILQGPLKREEGFEGIGITNDHDDSSCCVKPSRTAGRAKMLG